ncbi:P-loop NTPase fold protein [Aliarcobacter butzleri]|uniref:P-loop NTPase fold protein n=1 Tax=Aliarcobacter butzleri TaxID=28197 RepID=UPI0021B450F8|nr:P-loop NTPase fold protein [Aliarcobacter butzleri]MCT7595198.1 P-loop NTPase fold protein [Aliarcobacter butzleri]MCT7599893.1 P-loop NTPase fold protein [Aliarcobacter butzleri]
MIITTNIIQDRLIELLNSTQSFGIALNGKWGVGKTFFWNQLIEEKFSTKKTAYISLFGVETIQQIKNDLLLQIYTQNGFVKKIKDKVGSFKLYGMDISLALSWFEKKDFENVIVCFDDFERISDKLKLKDVLGLISELKEQKKCTVVLILNKKELKDEDLSKYKDKIVDYDFNYEPTVVESFSLIKDNLKSFKQYPLEYFQRHEINNIRIMKRVINALNDYVYFENLVKDYKNIEEELVENILEISTINALELSVDFETLSKYSNPYDLDEFSKQKYGEPKQEKQKNENYEKLLKYINKKNVGYFYISDITFNIIDYIKNSIVDKDSLQNSINERIKKEKYSSIQEQIRKCTHKARYDLNYSYNQYTKDLFNILESNQNNITEIINADNFLFYIQQLEEFDSENIEKYKKFAIDLLKKYLYIELKGDRYSSWVNQTISNIKNFDIALNDYYNDFEKNMKNEKISSLESITNLMLNPIRKSSWGEEPHLLAQVKEDDIEKYFYQDMNFVDDSLTFLVNSISRHGNFKIFRNKLLNVIKRINQNGNKDQQVKMKKILEYLKEE